MAILFQKKNELTACKATNSWLWIDSYSMGFRKLAMHALTKPYISLEKTLGALTQIRGVPVSTCIPLAFKC